jgi:hypothetical protein
MIEQTELIESERKALCTMINKLSPSNVSLIFTIMLAMIVSKPDIKISVEVSRERP